MKCVLLILWLSASLCLQAQEDIRCVVTSVKGSATYNGQALKVGDVLTYSRIREGLSLKLGTIVTFYSAKGSFKAQTSELQSSKQHHNFIHYAKELLRIKARQVSLSSRGDCDCVLPADCLQTDATINQKLLLVDTLSFPLITDHNADSFFYFLQYTDSGGTYNSRLKVSSGRVLITKDALHFGGRDASLQDGLKVQLGLMRFVKGKKLPSLVTTLYLEVMPATMLADYYTTLKAQMRDSSSEEVLQSLYTDLYVYYGKPDACRLQKMVEEIK